MKQLFLFLLFICSPTQLLPQALLNTSIIGSLSNIYASDIIVDNEFAYLNTINAGNCYLTILDISNEQSPKVKSQLLLGNFYPTKICKYLNYILYTHYGPIADNNYLKIINVSDALNPTLITDLKLSNDYASTIFTKESYAFIKTSNSMLSSGYIEIYNIGDIYNPVKVNTINYTIPLTDIFVEGDYLYTCDRSGFMIYDIKNPQSPIFMSTTSLTQGVSTLFVKNNQVFVSSLDAGYFRIYDVSDKANPLLCGTYSKSYSSGKDIKCEGNFAYIADFDRLNIFDISNPNDISLVGYLRSSQLRTYALEIKNSLVYLTDQYEPFVLKVVKHHKSSIVSNIQELVYNIVNISTSLTKKIIIKNTGYEQLIVTSITHRSSAFQLNNSISSIMPGDSAEISISFYPTQPIQYLDTLFVYNNSAINPFTIVLNGVGGAPEISTNSNSMLFGNVNVYSSIIKTLTITNTGTTDLVITDIITSDNSFSVDKRNMTINAKSSAIFYIEFKPNEIKFYSDTLWIHSNASINKKIINLSGYGIGAKIQSSSTKVDFGNTEVNNSVLHELVITNIGNVNLIVSNLVTSNDVFMVNPTFFSLNPTQSKKLSLFFTPKQPGNYSGYLIISNNSIDNPFTIELIGRSSTSSLEENDLPYTFDLYQNYPNPFNPITRIKYQIPNVCFVSLKVYNSLGKEIYNLVSEIKEPGYYEVLFNVQALASGVYYYKLYAGLFSKTKKLVVLK